MLYIFDVNETLLDLRPIGDLFHTHFDDRNLQHEWFDGMIHSALVVTATGGYADFSALAVASMRQVAARRDVTLPDDTISALGVAMRTLLAHPEVPAALRSLRAGGHRIVALANSPLATVTAQLTHADLLDAFDAVYSAEQAGQLKPGPAPYLRVLEIEEVPATQATLVAAHGWDVAGAQAAGLTSVFVTRDGRSPVAGVSAPTSVVTHLGELRA